MGREGYLVYKKLQAIKKKSVALPIIKVPVCISWCSTNNIIKYISKLS